MESDFVLSETDCIKILNKFPDNNLEFVSYKLLPFGKEPMGFLGEHLRLQIISNTKSKRNVTLSFFLKTIPTTLDVHTKYVMDSRIFEKEIGLYRQLLSELQQYSHKQFLPTCYLAHTNQICLILEDLQSKGYCPAPSKTLDFQHCKCVLQTLARFHASSVIFEESKKVRINDLYNELLYETTFSFEEGHPRNDWLKTTVAALVEVCEFIEEIRLKGVKKLFDDFLEDVKKFIQPSRKYRNVLNHGDLWTNNVMFSYNSFKKPESCILVDYQFARYVPPAFDFLTFIFLATDASFLEANFTTFLNIYYSTFEAQLKLYNFNSSEVFPKKTFLESCEFYKPAALLEATMFATIVFLNGDLSKDMLLNSDIFSDFMHNDRSKLVVKLFKEDPIYREKLTGLIIKLISCIE